jgi:hypothetical protein
MGAISTVSPFSDMDAISGLFHPHSERFDGPYVPL